MSFVVGALQKGFLNINGASGTSDLGQFERAIYDGLSTSLVLDALNKAVFNDGGKAPVTTIGKETYTTVAHANYVNGGTSSIDFYDPFFKQSATGQYQTAIHEAMHLIWNIGDEDFAKAIGEKAANGLAASAAWHEKLKKNYK